jgi:hypothetical protein
VSRRSISNFATPVPTVPQPRRPTLIVFIYVTPLLTLKLARIFQISRFLLLASGFLQLASSYEQRVILYFASGVCFNATFLMGLSDSQ